MTLEETEMIRNFAPFGEKMPGAVVIHDIRTGTIAWMSERALKGIGTTAEEIIGRSLDHLHGNFFNPEDAKEYVPKILDLLKRNNDEEFVSYFEQVKLAGMDDWTWHMSSVRIFMRNNEEAPILLVSISIPIDSMHHMTAKASRLLAENNFLRQNLSRFANLTRREREVLRFIVLGKTAPETAEALFISVNTVETHRKNIRQKLGTTSYFELSQYARAFDII